MKIRYLLACLALAGCSVAWAQDTEPASPPGNSPQTEQPGPAEEEPRGETPATPSSTESDAEDPGDPAESAGETDQNNTTEVNEANAAEPVANKTDTAAADEDAGLFSGMLRYLLMLAAGFAGGIAALLAMRFVRRGTESRIEEAAERLEGLVAKLRAGVDSDRTGGSGGGQKPFQEVTGKERAGAIPDKQRGETYGLFGEPIKESQLEQRVGDERDAWLPQRQNHEHDSPEAIDPAVASYAAAIERGEKLRTLEVMIKQFDQPRGVKLDQGQIVGAPFRVDDPTLFVFAFPEGDAFLVVPVPEYVDKFPGSWSHQAENPKIIRELFERVVDHSGQLRLLRPARLEIDGTGRLQVSRQGKLAGFMS